MSEGRRGEERGGKGGEGGAEERGGEGGAEERGGEGGRAEEKGGEGGDRTCIVMNFISIVCNTSTNLTHTHVRMPTIQVANSTVC